MSDASICCECSHEKAQWKFNDICEDCLDKLRAENKKLRDALNAVITFHGFHKDIQYRDIDGEMYPLNTEQLEKILKEIDTIISNMVTRE